MLALDSVHTGLPWLAALGPRLADWVPNETIGNYLRLAALPLDARYRGVSRAFFPAQKRLLLGENGAARSSGELDDLFFGYFRAAAGATPLGRMLYVDAKVWLADDLLLKADKMTMANSLELRVPFLDHKLVEFAATLPEDRKLNGASGKYLLRRAMRSALPKLILKRPKKGFPVPTERWLRGQLKDFAREALLGGDSACGLYLDRKAIQQIVSEHEQGRADRHQEIWTLLVFEFWHRVFLGRGVRPAAEPAEDLIEAA